MPFEIIQNKETDKWFWRLRAKNGEILCHSENYQTEWAARKGIKSTRINAITARVETRSS